MRKSILAVMVAALGSLLTNHVVAQGTAFSYQGRLSDGGAPANGNYDLTFSLYYANATGVAVAGPVTNSATVVSNGLFTTAIDFGSSVFNGTNCWLEIGVRTNGSVSAFGILTPRQQITPTPYAIFANTANNVTGTVSSGNLSGTYANAVTFNNPGNSFTGNGAGLTALTPANLSAGTAGINISGNAASATSFTGSLVGEVTGTQGATAVSSVGGQTAANVAGGASAANAATSANTASTIVKRDASGNFSAGTITAALSGNATSATTATSFTGNIADTQLSANIARLNGTNVFSGTNTFNGVVIADNANNQFTGTFTGNGAGLTGIAAAATPPVGMVLIPAGTFSMGDSLDGESDAIPTNIFVSQFYMDINLVSLSQWQSVYFWATNHGYGFVNVGTGKAANNPVQTVDWYDAVKWSNARSVQGGLTPVYYTDAGFTHIYTNGEVAPYMNMAANGYRLPTEAEWEKAARGGLSGQRFPWGNVINENLANYSGETASYTYDLGPNGYNAVGSVGGTSPATSPVGSFAPNGYGLFDMAGNVFEWCGDWYGTPYGQPTATNPTGPATGSYRVLRGGDWNGGAALNARCANRNGNNPNLVSDSFGFRCVRGL